MLLAVLKAEPMTDQKAVYDKVKAEYATKGLVVLNEAPLNNTYNMVVRPETAAQYKLETLSDLAQGREGAEAGRRPRVSRSQGRPARPQGEVRHRVQGRPADGDRACAIRRSRTSRSTSSTATATDGMISALKLKRLKDDKNLWPPYYLVPVVRKDALDANPKIADVLNQVDALLDEATMAEMNYKVDGDKEEPRTSRARS